jgi:capsular polysaccharide biosynthesis protein
MSNGNAFTDGRESVMRSLASRGWLIGALVVLGGGAGYAYGTISPASYTANAYLVVVPLATASTSGTTPDAQGFATAFTRIAGQPQIQAAAAADAGVSLSTMVSGSTAATSPDAPVISISGVSTNAQTAAAEANGLAKAIEDAASTQTANTLVAVDVLSAAVPPTAPSSASASLDAAVGAAAGILLGALAGLSGVGIGGRKQRSRPKAERERRDQVAGPGAPWPLPADERDADAAESAELSPALSEPSQAETTIQMSILDPKRVTR